MQRKRGPTPLDEAGGDTTAGVEGVTVAAEGRRAYVIPMDAEQDVFVTGGPGANGASYTITVRDNGQSRDVRYSPKSEGERNLLLEALTTMGVVHVAWDGKTITRVERKA